MPWNPFHSPHEKIRDPPSSRTRRQLLESVAAPPGSEFETQLRSGRTLKASRKKPRTNPMIDNNPLSTQKWFNIELYWQCKATIREMNRTAPPAVTRAERDLGKCLMNAGTGGDCGMYDQAALENAARNLPSVQKLAKRTGLGCITVTRGGQCASYLKNKETEGQSLRSSRPVKSSFQRPIKDMESSAWGTCAVVGRSPIIKLSDNGVAIDKHEAVWRFNLDSAPSEFAKYTGRKTTVRVMNQGSTHKAQDIHGKEKSLKQWHPGEHQRWMNDVVKKKPGRQDWVAWHIRSGFHLDAMHKLYGVNVKVRLISPKFIDWMLQGYYEIMADLKRIGVPHLSCEINSMPGGTHALFLALATCRNPVSLFGLSYSKEILTNRAAHLTYKWVPYEHHNWDFDGYIFRLLHIAGKATICTRDDASVALNQLVQKQKKG
ncbi:hypothetical protein CYMTET_26391 [Cymbomonas tetramitiformis]|uniref:Uncharacterized protein n=1 Tax=Cymbomonas tetramitiformis TaxID=36881 RepID=A0AAE0FRX8_9CHLO|nr:hypothetical protein CYMTET_26391 [Cymbomonas tetramitiformis]